MKFRHLFLILPLVAALAACGHDDPEQEKEKDRDKAADKEIKKEDERLPICPQTAIVRELEEVRDYGREKPNDESLVAKAMMKNVDGTCEYRDKKKQQGIDIKFDLNMLAMRGPRLGGLHASFPYFVAVVDPSGKVLNKLPMTADIHFSSENKPAVFAESLHVFLPLDKKSWSTGPDYQVLIGWQLTGDQLNARLKAEGKDPIGQDTDKPAEAKIDDVQPADSGNKISDTKPADNNATAANSGVNSGTDSKTSDGKPADTKASDSKTDWKPSDAPIPSVLRLPTPLGNNPPPAHGGMQSPDAGPVAPQ